MQAAVLQKDRSLTVESVPIPKLLPRSVRVKMLAVQMAPYTTDVVSGKCNDLLHLLRPMCSLRPGPMMNMLQESSTTGMVSLPSSLVALGSEKYWR